MDMRKFGLSDPDGGRFYPGKSQPHPLGSRQREWVNRELLRQKFKFDPAEQFHGIAAMVRTGREREAA